MSGNDLDVPHGSVKNPDQDPDSSRVGRMRDIPWSGLALSGMGLIAVSLVAFVMVTDEGPARPPLIATLEPILSKRISVPDMATAPAAAPRDEATSSIGRTVRTRIPQADAGESRLARSQRDARASLPPAPDPRLIAPGPHGPLPRIGRDGARPADVYARPLEAGGRIAPGAPRIAIVVTGMGLDAQTSARALEILPPAITLAYAAYGETIEDQAERARAAGHELLLQAPMEGLADSHAAAPRTLAVHAPRDRMLDALHWHMGRFAGYVGVINLNGARFMASAQAFAPALQDMAERGLLFLDDGASPQSLALPLGAAAGAQTARADLVLDASPAPEAVDAALRELESLARERGMAIGVASARLQSIDRIGRFTQALEERGIVLAPASSLIAAPARTSAR